jgi:hypothetical protein
MKSLLAVALLSLASAVLAAPPRSSSMSASAHTVASTRTLSGAQDARLTENNSVIGSMQSWWHRHYGARQAGENRSTLCTEAARLRGNCEHDRAL